MVRYFSLALVLLAVWLLLSGHYDPLLISLGVASVILTTWIAARLKIVDIEGHPIHIALRTIRYFPWLFWEIVKSNVDVARRVLSPSLPVSPRVFTVQSSQRTAVGRTIYANSITLTPGTVTIDVRGSELDVHSLTSESAAEIQSGRMDARVTIFEGAD
ncbi:MAG: Na+/H+ antiporter subunit E [Gammaproteobacteria bacterium]|nr:MAG: Na+/H+ antiporter subunit E [Gammaproteobacteria bacterium]